jgi:hypothetical protein
MLRCRYVCFWNFLGFAGNFSQGEGRRKIDEEQESSTGSFDLWHVRLAIFEAGN